MARPPSGDIGSSTLRITSLGVLGACFKISSSVCPLTDRHSLWMRSPSCLKTAGCYGKASKGEATKEEVLDAEYQACPTMGAWEGLKSSATISTILLPILRQLVILSV